METLNALKKDANELFNLTKESVQELQKSLEDLVPSSNETDIFYGEYNKENLKDISDDVTKAIIENDMIAGSYIIQVKHIQD